MIHDRCDYCPPGDYTAVCDAPAIGGGGNGAAWCAVHRPCACGGFLVAAGEVFADHGGGLMPGEVDTHTRERCTVSTGEGPEVPSEIIERGASPWQDGGR